MRQLSTGHQMTQKSTTIGHHTVEWFFHTLFDAIFNKEKRNERQMIFF